MDIDGKVIVITGAARGIGQEYARYLAGLGGRVVAADIADCAATLDLVKTGSGTAIGVRLDVANAASAQDMARAALDAFGRIDALVNNAALYGALKGGRFDAISEPDWDAAMAVNVKGIWNCCKAVVPALRQVGRWQHRQYRVAGRDLRDALRAALHHLQGRGDRAHARSCARAGRDNIRVNAIAPSAVLTEGTPRILCREDREGARLHPSRPARRVAAQPQPQRSGRDRALAGVRRAAASSPGRPLRSTAEP